MVIIPLAAGNPLVIFAPVCAAVEVEGNGVVRGSGVVGGDLKINRIVRPRPAAVRHLRPCAVFRRAVPEVGHVHSQFVQGNRLVIGGIQLQGAAGEGHGTVVDAGCGTHRKAAAVHGGPTVQAAGCSGDGHHAALIDRDTAVADGCAGLVNFQRAINVCTAAGNCIVSVLNDQLAAAFDRGTTTCDTEIHIADRYISGNICTRIGNAISKCVQCDISTCRYIDRLCTTKPGVQFFLPIGQCKCTVSVNSYLLPEWVDCIVCG